MPNLMSGLISLPCVLPRLCALAGSALPDGLTYRRLYLQALDGTLPTQRVNGRHYIAEDQLSELAAHWRIVLSHEAPNKPASRCADKGHDPAVALRESE